jgi:hypothetical protein|tara:strand:+ start:230 stop:634 length:405 start_codon:yes stop_codon:yes gene_type:complete
VNILLQEMSNKKPDMYAESKAVMPYGDSVAAPKIEIPDTNSWVVQQSVDVNNYLSTKFAELKKEYADLISLYKWNELVNKSDFSFIPVKGHIYFLYQRENENLFLSLIEPEYWGELFVGSVKLDSDNKWIQVLK